MKKIIFTPTGETRQPKKGEWYLVRNTTHIQRACEDWQGCDAMPIYTRTEEEYTWKPEHGTWYWYVDTDFKPRDTYFDHNHVADDNRRNAGNCFPTKELCEQFIKEKGLK